MLKLVIMSDIHIALRTEFKFGLDTAERLEKAIKDVNSFYDDADLCIFAGDIADTGLLESYQLFDEIRKNCSVKSVVMMGNHDNRETYLNYDKDAMVDENGFVQGSVDIKGYKIIMIDSSEAGHVDGVLCEKRLAWLAGQLANAKSAQTPVILILHHNANRLHMPVDTYSLSEPDNLADVLKHSGAQIAQIIAGHCHITTAGSWHGFPIATLSGNQHRVGTYFRNMTDHQQPCYEGPAQFAVIVADKTNLTVHFHNYIDRNIQFPNAMFPWKRKQKFLDN